MSDESRDINCWKESGTSRPVHVYPRGRDEKDNHYYVEWKLPRYNYRKGNFEAEVKTFILMRMKQLNGCKKIKLSILKGKLRNQSGKGFNMLRCDFKCKNIENIGQGSFKFQHHRITCACRKCIDKYWRRDLRSINRVF